MLGPVEHRAPGSRCFTQKGIAQLGIGGSASSMIQVVGATDPGFQAPDAVGYLHPMIVKAKTPAHHDDVRLRAGDAAERQVAFYLQRAFGPAEDIAVLNDLRIEHDGEAAQMDHLVIHPHGFVIVESKSGIGGLVVNRHLEWSIRINGRLKGVPSPIQQAQRQGELLTRLLDTHHAQLLGKKFGLIQNTFTGLPVQVVVAVSDGGAIERVGGVEVPEVRKADQACDCIRDQIGLHRKNWAGLLADDPFYGRKQMSAEVISRVAGFLASRHVDPPRAPARSGPQTVPCISEQRGGSSESPKSAPRPRTAAPATPVATAGPAQHSVRCKHCRSDSLRSALGRYGHYLKCGSCGGNTPLPWACSVCGTKGKVTKDGPSLLRACAACRISEVIWRDDAS